MSVIAQHFFRACLRRVRSGIHQGKGALLVAPSDVRVPPGCCASSIKTQLRRGCLFTMKLETPEFRSLFTPELNELTRLFRENGFEIRLAGGPVRDLLLGKTPKDLDFATDATPDQMKTIFEKAGVRMINNRGEKHGTVTPRIFDKENYEVTTLRIDVVTDGRHAEVQFTNDWELDAGRRDLTINSMFLGLDGTVYDYFGGSEDLKKRRVAFVGDAETRMKEDYLRILRYFRFYGRIADDSCSHDDATLDAIRRNVDGLKIISGERIWTEFRQILVGRFGGELFSLILQCGCAPFVGFPEDYNLEEVSAVQERLRGTEFNAITLAVAALRTVEEMMDMHERLKLSGFERDLGFFLILHRNDSRDLDRPLRPYQFLLADAKREKRRDFRAWILELMKYRGEPRSLMGEFDAWQTPEFPVTGHALTQNKVPKGKIMSEVLIELKGVWKESDFAMSCSELEAQIPIVLEKLQKRSASSPVDGGSPGKRKKLKT